MEQHYMSLIWDAISLKENENLTVKQQQDKIVTILSKFKKEVEEYTKHNLKKQCIKAIEKTLLDL
jgi:hypothetical protein